MRSRCRADEAHPGELSSALRACGPMIRDELVGGLFGYEDKAEGIVAGSSRAQVSRLSAEEAARVDGGLNGGILGEERDQDNGDLFSGVDEDALDEDDLDTDRVAGDDGRSANLQAMPGVFAPVQAAVVYSCTT